MMNKLANDIAAAVMYKLEHLLADDSGYMEKNALDMATVIRALFKREARAGKAVYNLNNALKGAEDINFSNLNNLGSRFYNRLKKGQKNLSKKTNRFLGSEYTKLRVGEEEYPMPYDWVNKPNKIPTDPINPGPKFSKTNPISEGVLKSYQRDYLKDLSDGLELTRAHRLKQDIWDTSVPRYGSGTARQAAEEYIKAIANDPANASRIKNLEHKLMMHTGVALPGFDARHLPHMSTMQFKQKHPEAYAKIRELLKTDPEGFPKRPWESN